MGQQLADGGPPQRVAFQAPAQHVDGQRVDGAVQRRKLYGHLFVDDGVQLVELRPESGHQTETESKGSS